MNGMLATLYYDTNDTHYNAITTCAHQFSSPTYDILNALHEVIFRTALQSNNGTVTNFTVEETDQMPFYYVKNRWWIPALTIMSFTILILLCPILGFLRSKEHDLPEDPNEKGSAADQQSMNQG